MPPTPFLGSGASFQGPGPIPMALALRAIGILRIEAAVPLVPKSSHFHDFWNLFGGRTISYDPLMSFFFIPHCGSIFIVPYDIVVSVHLVTAQLPNCPELGCYQMY